ncbi:MAG: hypothetical protein DRN71_03610, partial [Candidatus Nanohalarchaeota archaeon]
SDPDGLYEWDISAYPSTTGVDIRCNATDSYDDSSYFNPTGTVTIDNTKPTITHTFPKNNTYLNYLPTLNGTCTDNTAIDTIWTNSTTYTTKTTTSPYSFQNTTMLTNNHHHITIQCNDTLNNTASTQLYFTYDTINPKIRFTPPTKQDGATISKNHTYINTTVYDTSDATAFVDWNQSLIGWWRFNHEPDENVTFFRDWSTYANNATCSGGNCPNNTASGKFANALLFDGHDDYLNCGNDSSLNIINAITIEAWIKPNEIFSTQLGEGYTVKYNANELPGDASPPWSKRGSEPATMSEGILTIVDTKTDEYRDYYHLPWGMNRSVGATILTRIKVNSASGSCPTGFYLVDAVNWAIICFTTDTVGLMDSTALWYNVNNSEFQSYRITYQNGNVNIYLNENPTPILSDSIERTYGANAIQFGSSAYTSDTSESEWDYIHYDFTGAHDPNNESYLKFDLVSKSEDTYALEIRSGTLYGFINNQTVSASIDKQWHHIALSYNGSRQMLYIDGILRNNKALSSPINTIQDNLKIGNNFNGTIDEVRIWNRALSPEEINASYKAGLYRLYHNFTNLQDGTHEYTAYAQDLAGNLNQTETITITIDTTPPTVTLIYPANNTWYNTSTLNLTFHTNDNIDTLIECNRTLDNINEHIGYIPKNTQNTTTMTSLAEQNHYVNITCIDNANNTQTSETILFKIDTIPPTTTDNATGDWKPDNHTVLLSCADTGSGCNTTIYCIDNETNDCTPDTIGTTPEFTCPQGQICTGYIRYSSNDTAGNHETVKNTTLIRIDTTIPAITNCKATPALIDNDTKTSTTIEISCTINTTGSPLKSTYMTTDQPYGTHLNTTQMNTTLCTTPEPKKYCAFFHPNASTTLGKLYFHINATNEVNRSNYQQNSTTSEINDLTIIYNATTIESTYYSFQTITPQVHIYFAENNSYVNSANVTFHLKNTTSILNTSHKQTSNGQANTSFYLDCTNETQQMHINTSATYCVLNEYNISWNFNHSPVTTTTDCWFDQIEGKIDIYCSYNDTISNKYIQDALLLLNTTLGGTCNTANAVMDYNPTTQLYNYSCTPSVGETYCSIPINVTAQKACYEEATYNKDAATTIGFNIDTYFIPDNIHTMDHTTLWINTTATDSDANGVNITITQTDGPTIYGPWNIIEDHYHLGYLTKDISHIVTSDTSIPSREQTNNYSVDITVSWNNTNCAGTTTAHPQLKILDSYYVDFTNIALNKNKFEPKDTLSINGTIENIGNIPVTGNLTATIINSAGHTKGTLTCNASVITIPFNTGRDFTCAWTVTGPKRGITTGNYKVRLRYDAAPVSLLHEKDIYITVSEEPPKNKNVYVTSYPITVIDRYGKTSQRIIKIYTWME